MSQEWKSGLCGCFGDCGTCCCGYWCPCCLTYRNAESLGKSGILCCLLWDGPTDCSLACTLIIFISFYKLTSQKLLHLLLS